MLETGSKAIDFTLPDEQGNPVSLHSFKGKKVVLYFYPKDNTPDAQSRPAHLRQPMMNLNERISWSLESVRIPVLPM